jgi:hypothetical protein
MALPPDYLGGHSTKPDGTKRKDDVRSDIHASRESLAVAEEIDGLISKRRERRVPSQDSHYQNRSYIWPETTLALNQLRYATDGEAARDVHNQRAEGKG